MLRAALEAVARINQLIRHENPSMPLLYDSGVRFGAERQTTHDEIPDVATLYQVGVGDCAPLSAARIAELREAGERADFKLYWRPERSPLPYHVQVRRWDGTIEDPSRRLGMAGLTSH